MTETDNRETVTPEELAAAAALLRGEDELTSEEVAKAIEPAVEDASVAGAVDESTTEAAIEEDLDAAIEAGLVELEKAIPAALAAALKKKGKKLAATKDDEDEDDDEDTKEAKKALEPVADAQLAALAATLNARLEEGLAEVRRAVEDRLSESKKSLDAVVEYQGATVPIFQQMKDVLERQAKEIEDIGNAAAPRGAVRQVVAKALPAQDINLEPVLRWARGVTDAVGVLQIEREVKNGDFSRVPAEVRKEAGL